MKATITIDSKKAERILKEVGKRIRKSGFRNVARNAAKIVETDLTTTAPIWNGSVKRKVMGKSKYHLFTRKKTGYRMWIKRGNLRKSMKTFVFKKSNLLWVGSRYGAGAHLAVVGGSKATSDGFYDKWVINGSHGGGRNDYMAKTKTKTEAQVKNQLEKDGSAFIAKIVAKANATP